MRVQLSWLRPVVAVALLTAVPVVARAQSPAYNDPKETPEVKRVVLDGANHVDVVDLEHSIATTASACKSLALTPFCWISHSATFVDREYLDHAELARDIIRIRVYYWLRGYRSADVDTIVTKTAPNEATVTFKIAEHEPTIIRRISVDYDSTIIDQRRVEKLQMLRAGQPLDFIRLDSTRVAFANHMWGAGYSDAAIDTTLTYDATGLIVDLHMAIIPNRPTFVGDVEVAGLERVSRATVLNSITLKPGDRFRQGDVLESQRNLFESNLFRLAAVVVPPQFDSVKKVTITVAESPLHDADIGFGVSNVDYIQTQGTYTAYNLLGGARRLDLTANVGNLLANQLAGRGFFYNPASDVLDGDATRFLTPTWSASADFRQPAFLRRPSNQLGFSAFGHRRSTPGIFIDRGFGGSMTFTNQVLPRAPVSATYRFEINRVDAGDVYFCVNYGVCDTLAIGGLRSHQRLSPVILSGFIDRSDEPLDPTRGYQARVDFEYASAATLSDYAYSRAFFDVAAYDHHGTKSVYSAHLRFGVVRPGSTDDLIHPRKLFFAGGASSVRGFGPNQLGPRILTVSSDRLTDTNIVTSQRCSTATIADRSCDPNIAQLGDNTFKPQPLGGKSLLEGSIEYRFPIALRQRLTMALFIDAGVVGAGALPSLATLGQITHGEGAITPGFGFRYKSSVGPIRVDVGFSPARTDQLRVATETLVNGERKIVILDKMRAYTPAKTLLDRLTLHFSIGQAY